jgi:hypothetical protein
MGSFLLFHSFDIARLHYFSITHFLLQRLLWPPDGKHLALVVAGSGQAGTTALTQEGRARSHGQANWFAALW